MAALSYGPEIHQNRGRGPLQAGGPIVLAWIASDQRRKRGGALMSGTDTAGLPLGDALAYSGSLWNLAAEILRRRGQRQPESFTVLQHEKQNWSRTGR